MSMRHAGARLDSKQAAKAVVFERRLLMYCTISVTVGLLLWVISISTEYWFTVDCPNGAYINRTGIDGLEPGYLTYSYSGLWRTCKTIFHNSSAPAVARSPAMAADMARPEANRTEPEMGYLLPEVNGTALNGTEMLPSPLALVSGQTTSACAYMRFTFLKMLDNEHPLNVVIAYRRTCLGFSVISILLAGMAIFFSVYTFRVRRYTFKRVAACLHLMVAALQLVVVEVKVTSLQYQNINVESVIPNGCTWHYSAGFVLGWICFIISLVAGIIFLYTSGKKKKRPEGNAPEGAQEEEDDFDDEPQIMGR